MSLNIENCRQTEKPEDFLKNYQTMPIQMAEKFNKINFNQSQNQQQNLSQIKENKESFQKFKGNLFKDSLDILKESKYQQIRNRFNESQLKSLIEKNQNQGSENKVETKIKQRNIEWGKNILQNYDNNSNYLSKSSQISKKRYPSRKQDRRVQWGQQLDLQQNCDLKQNNVCPDQNQAQNQSDKNRFVSISKILKNKTEQQQQLLLLQQNQNQQYQDKTQKTDFELYKTTVSQYDRSLYNSQIGGLTPKNQNFSLNNNKFNVLNKDIQNVGFQIYLKKGGLKYNASQVKNLRSKTIDLSNIANINANRNQKQSINDDETKTCYINGMEINIEKQKNSQGYGFYTQQDEGVFDPYKDKKYWEEFKNQEKFLYKNDEIKKNLAERKKEYIYYIDQRQYQLKYFNQLPDFMDTKKQGKNGEIKCKKVLRQEKRESQLAQKFMQFQNVNYTGFKIKKNLKSDDENQSNKIYTNQLENKKNVLSVDLNLESQNLNEVSYQEDFADNSITINFLKKLNQKNEIIDKYSAKKKKMNSNFINQLRERNREILELQRKEKEEILRAELEKQKQIQEKLKYEQNQKDEEIVQNFGLSYLQKMQEIQKKEKKKYEENLKKFEKLKQLSDNGQPLIQGDLFEQNQQQNYSKIEYFKVNPSKSLKKEQKLNIQIGQRKSSVYSEVYGKNYEKKQNCNKYSKTDNQNQSEQDQNFSTVQKLLFKKLLNK
ncbi:hypothetical protein PPERSA_00402 [Pseudocohnilembus persalinus]|uniref:Uncharacterized protein n=1 Tax=Pseudocohnilembus persalinus TaxID=266149 RepID=A0A0V0QYV6_PSEPJ|nr:hypothetical protein PPERSA_00402 [Pseudocohnilembus persalinus]|eukprot:KRX07245.1 hypothetical protein PPERSA_00402 [Pseudocohnilembus persalinus]